MPDQSKEEFRFNVRRLKQNSEQFNLDVSGICQWLMGIRPGGKRGFGDEVRPLWEFFLAPENVSLDGDANKDKLRLDSLRVEVFEVAVKWRGADDPAVLQIPEEIISGARRIADSPLESTDICGSSLFERLHRMQRTHLAIILKSAADWIYSRYQRPKEKWAENRPIWERERVEWEKSHSELKEGIREKFNAILLDMGIKSKSFRICPAEKLLNLKHNCEIGGKAIPSGEKFIRHHQNCYNYWNFCREMSKNDGKTGFNKKQFAENANRYLKISGRNQKLTGDERLWELYRELKTDDKKFNISFDKWKFPNYWRAYQKFMGLNVGKMRAAGGIEKLHCTSFGSDCCFNKHTELCEKYAKHLKDLPSEIHVHDKVYRQWRKKFFRGPRKPTFTYPSAASPAPKIFGREYYRIDWEQSVIGIRLEGMPTGQFLEFRFKEWPRRYDIEKARDAVTSVSIHFVGTRAKVALRFETPQKPSRFILSQEEIEDLRSGENRPREDERSFPEPVRRAILESFNGDPEKDLRILTVDTGTSGGAAVGLFIGKEFKECEVLKIVKSKELLQNSKDLKAEREVEHPDGTKEKRFYVPGLSREHHQLHLERYAGEAAKFADFRPAAKDTGGVNYTGSDLRRLRLHSGWMIRDWARLNASQIIAAAEKFEVHLILMESQRGFVAPGYDKLSESIKKHRMAFWPYGLVRRKVTEKAVERGMRVTVMPYKGSSRTCPECGQKNRSHFCKCNSCNFKPSNRDESAVRVLGKLFWGELSLPEI